MDHGYEATGDVYDEVHYPGLSHELSHPGHMGAVAQVLGLNPASPEHCRGLEIGCAAGYNLIPMAEMLPGMILPFSSRKGAV